jgi:DNA invertase Pin-like site-specific DNA recombinase
MVVVIYARRSSDREDHQILSIEQQLDVLLELAADRGIDLAEELVENASAKDPGRPIFNDLIKKIRAGKGQGILVRRLDRLARNMVDAGEIIYEMTQGKLNEIVTPEATYTGERRLKVHAGHALRGGFQVHRRPGRRRCGAGIRTSCVAARCQALCRLAT